jgi:hypothetical protein
MTNTRMRFLLISDTCPTDWTLGQKGGLEEQSYYEFLTRLNPLIQKYVLAGNERRAARPTPGEAGDPASAREREVGLTRMC